MFLNVETCRVYWCDGRSETLLHHRPAVVAVIPDPDFSFCPSYYTDSNNVDRNESSKDTHSTTQHDKRLKRASGALSASPITSAAANAVSHP